MDTKNTFDLKSDWNYLPPSHKARDGESWPKSFPKSELKGLTYDDLRGLSWAILEEHN